MPTVGWFGRWRSRLSGRCRRAARFLVSVVLPHTASRALPAAIGLRPTLDPVGSSTGEKRAGGPEGWVAQVSWRTLLAAMWSGVEVRGRVSVARTPGLLSDWPPVGARVCL